MAEIPKPSESRPHVRPWDNGELDLPDDERVFPLLLATIKREQAAGCLASDAVLKMVHAVRAEALADLAWEISDLRKAVATAT